MKIDFDPEVDAVYLQINEVQIAKSEQVESGVIFDFNECGSVVGVEILGVKKKELQHLLSLKIPFHSPEDFKAFKSFLIERATV